MPSETQTLREQIDSKAALAKTKRLDLSFHELADMVKEGELEIKPAFQRLFVWTEVKQSQFIESLLLELPVPPIYVVELSEGHYVLVDGLQRLSSYLHFRGELNNPTKNIELGGFFALRGCDIAPELNERTWRDLDTALQIRLKRAFVSVQVIRKESDPKLQFHMFKRLNDGGTPVSPQQVRNCVIRMLPGGSELMDFVDELAQDPGYRICCVECLTQEQLNEQFQQELVLRFLALKNDIASFKHDVSEFIGSFSERIANESPGNFEFPTERLVFQKSFRILARSTNDLSFTYPNKAGTDLTRGFSALHFEGVTIGLQKYLDRLDPDDGAQMKALKDILFEARLSREFREVSSGGGRNSPGLLKQRVEIIERKLGEKLFNS